MAAVEVVVVVVVVAAVAETVAAVAVDTCDIADMCCNMMADDMLDVLVVRTKIDRALLVALVLE